jgi:uncharacterized FlaG/YvyC family protein
MGMDGLSMANTGALKESTSADFASRTEQSMQADRTNDAKQVQTLSTNPRIKEKDEEEEGKKQKQEQKSQEDIEDSFVPSEDEFEKEEFDIEELENPNKDFYVKLNAKDDIIELYDSATDRLIETISGNELKELVRKLNMASGIFVNKKV